MAYIEPIQSKSQSTAGKDILLFIANDTKSTQYIIPNAQTSTGFSASANASSETTKQGTVSKTSAPEYTIPFEAQLTQDDVSIQLIKEALNKNKTLAIWVVYADPNHSIKITDTVKGYSADHAIVNVGEFSMKADSENSATISATFNVTGGLTSNTKLVDGVVTIDPELAFPISDEVIEISKTMTEYINPSEQTATKVKAV